MSFLCVASMSLPGEIDSPAEGKIRSWSSLMRRGEQLVLALVLFISTGVIGSYWVRAHWGSTRTVDIERDGPLPEIRESFAASTPQLQIDVNKAKWPELTLLPGVGETLARRIVESRELDGEFQHPADLYRVRGIGPKTLERMLPYLKPTELEQKSAQID